MNGGRIAQVGTPLEVYNNPADTFVAGFLGSPPMNLIDAVSEGGRRIRAAGAIADVPPDRMAPCAPGTRLTVGVRPEDLEITSAGNVPQCGFTGEVQQVERLGAETIVAVRSSQGVRLVARRPGDARIVIGESIGLFASAQAYRVFDENGKSLQTDRSEAAPWQNPPS
jgi:ABC-type sugar transport system ATPase subunit